MKCRFCKSKVNKHDELCPECGRYLNKKAAVSAAKKDADSPFGRVLKVLDCKNYGGDLLTVYAFVSFLLIGSGIYDIYKSHYLFSSILGLFIYAPLILGVLSAITGITTYLKLRKCFVCLSENGIYGVRPRLFRKSEWFEIYYKDITDFKCKIPASFSGRRFFFRSIPRVRIVADGTPYTFCCFDTTDSSTLATCIRTNMPKRSRKKK